MNNYNNKELFALIKKLYLSKGLYILPCWPKSKHSVFKEGWQNEASNDENKVKEWIEKYPNSNWAILPNKSGHLVADIDPKLDEKFGSTGVEYFQMLCEKNGEPQTWASKTGSGGFHYLFKAIEGEKYGGKFDGHKGVDIRFKNYIVVYPSIHPNGEQYTWINDLEISDFPEWMKEGFKGINKNTIPKNKPKAGTFDWRQWLPDFQLLAEELKTKHFDYLEWVKIGMSIHSMMPDQDGLDLFLQITQGVNFQEGDVEGATYRWEGFEWGIDYGVTEKTLIWMARKLGCEIPEGLESLFDEWDIQNAHDRIEHEAETHKEFFVDWTDRHVTVHRDFALNWMNNRYAMMTVNPLNQIMYEHTTNGVKDASGVGKEKFIDYYSNRFYKYYDYSSKKPKAKYINLAMLWLQSSQRRECTNVVFKPVAESEEINLWSGIPCTGVDGDVGLFKELCFDVFANGDEAKGKWFMQWLAHIVQQPDVKCTLVPVFIGDQGTGKGLLADGIMKGILGPYFTRITKSSEFAEKFNKEYSKKFLTFIDEATWRGNKEEDGIMKSLTGSDTMMIEEKFGARYSIENYSRYYIASNNEEAVAVERSNRRYVIFKVNNEYRQRKEFFGPFWDQIKKGDMIQRIYHFLKNLDISTFDPFTLPMFDDQAADAQLATEGVVAQFWHHMIFDKPRAIFVKGKYLSKHQVVLEFNQFHKESSSWEKGINPIKFWMKTTKLIKILQGNEIQIRHGGGRTRAYVVTPFTLFESFCETFNLKMPNDFDDLDYLVEEDFND